MEQEKPTDNGVALAIQAAGSQKELGELLGITQQAVAKWADAGAIPPRRVLDVERATGISRHQLAPEVFGEAVEQ